MASRDWLKHSAGNSAPSDATLGDEWFNTSTNRLAKRVATNGTTVEWREVSGGVGVQQNGTTFAPSASILNFANATLELDGTTGTVRITSTASPGGSNTQVQYNGSGSLAGSAAFTWNNSTSTLSATNISSSGSITVGTGTVIDPSSVTGFAAGQITESTTGFSAPGIVIGSTAGQHGAIVYGSGTMYFGTETAATDNTMNPRMTLTSAGLFLPSLTSGRVTFATTSGQLTDSTSLTWNGTTLGVTGNVTISTLTSGRVTFATTSGQLTDSSSLTWNGTTLGVTGFVTTNRANLTGGINSSAWSGATGAGFNTAGTITDTSGAGGTVASRVNYSFNAATMAANVATTVTLGINLLVDAPVAGANTTFTDSYALYSQGRTRSTGALIADTTIQQIDGLIYRSANTAVSTAGSVQGDATAITRNINNVSTVGATTQGVRLPVPAVAGVRIVVRNATGTSFRIYPHSGGQINTLGTNVSLDLLAAQAVEFVAVTTAQWVTLNATYGA